MLLSICFGIRSKQFRRIEGVPCRDVRRGDGAAPVAREADVTI